MYEEYHGRVDVAYYGEPTKTTEEWAEYFGRKAITALLEGRRTPEVIGHYARLAGSFARIALEQTPEVEPTPEPEPLTDNMHPLMREHLNLVKAVYGVPGGGL